MNKITALIITAVILALCNTCSAAEIKADRSGWFVWELPDNEAALGSAIDVSFLLDAPAGRHGFIRRSGEKMYFEDGARARFWGVNLSGAANFSSKSQVEKIVDRIASSGYNIVRFHHMDAPWAAENIFGQGKPEGTRALDAQQLDKLFYLMAQLKERGIYFYVDLLVSRPPDAPEDQIQAAEDLENGWKYEALFDPYLIQLQKEYAKQLLTTVNPYTGLALKDDPAMVFIDILNENSIQGLKAGVLKNDYYRLQLQEKFNLWVKSRYASQAELTGSWGTLDGGESYGSVSLYDDYEKRAYSEARKNDTYHFLYTVAADFFSEFRRFLKEDLGVKCLVTGTSIGGASSQMPATFYMTAETDMDYVDRHGYVSHPYNYSFYDGMGYYDYKSAQSAMRGGGYLLSYPSWQRIYGMPHIIGEWLECIPNRFRAEANIMMSAYACFQDWHPIQFNLLSEAVPETRKALSSSFETYNDPVYTSTAAAASLVFHRQEVAEAAESYYMNRSQSQMLSRKSTELDGARDISPYGKVGIMLGDLEYSAEHNSPAVLERLQERAADLQPQSEEIDWNYKEGLFRLNTAYTNGVTGALNGQKISLNDVDFRIDNEFAAVILSSVTDERLKTSGRMLLTAAAGAENTGMEFSDTWEYMNKKGKAPVLAEPVCGTVELKRSSPVRVYALDSSGRRVKEIAVQESGNVRKFQIGGDQTLYYEITAKEPELTCSYEDGRITVSGTISGTAYRELNTVVALYRPGYQPEALNGETLTDAIAGMKQVKTDRLGRYSAEFAVSKTDCGSYTVLVNAEGKVLKQEVQNTDYTGGVSERSFLVNAEYERSDWRVLFRDGTVNGKLSANGGAAAEITADGFIKAEVRSAFAGVSLKPAEFGALGDGMSVRLKVREENTTGEIRTSFVCYPAGVYTEYIGGKVNLSEYPLKDGVRIVDIPLTEYRIPADRMGSMYELRIQAYGNGYSDPFDESNPGYLFIKDAAIVYDKIKSVDEAVWTAYENGFPEGITTIKRDGAKTEITENRDLRLTCTKPCGGVSFVNTAVLGLTDEIENVYLEFELQCENLKDDTIRVSFWYGDAWSPTEFGLWSYKVEGSGLRQTIRIPLSSVSSSKANWRQVQGIRIDPLNADSNIPVYLNLNHIRIVKEKERAVRVSARFCDEASNTVTALKPESRLYARAEYYNGMYETFSGRLCVVFAVYQDDRLIYYDAMKPENKEAGSLEGFYDLGKDCSGVSAKLLFLENLDSLMPYGTPLALY